MSQLTDRYVFWLDDITVLYKDYAIFFPTNKMTRIEQLNALSRFFIYLLLIFLITDRKDEWLYLPIIGLLLCIILYYVFNADETGKKEELIRIKRKDVVEKLATPDINYRTFVVSDDDSNYVVDIDKERDILEQEQELGQDKTRYNIETGYYDSDGKLITGEYNDAVKSLKSQNRDIKYTLDEYRTYEKYRSRKPTEDNPFMNPSVDDFNKDNVPLASNVDDDEINQDIEIKLNANMYRDIEDVFNNKNSQRQFFTVAHNIPNDQEAFGRWCYKFPKTCKTDQDRCLRYEDLRIKY